MRKGVAAAGFSVRRKVLCAFRISRALREIRASNTKTFTIPPGLQEKKKNLWVREEGEAIRRKGIEGRERIGSAGQGAGRLRRK